MKNQETVNIYIIEDSKVYAESLKQYVLNELGESLQHLRVKTFYSGETCIDSLFNGLDKPDVIVIDYHLNGKFYNAANGLHTMLQLKMISPETQTIFLSGKDDRQVTLDAFRSGAYDFILKNQHAFPGVVNSIRRCLAAGQPAATGNNQASSLE